MSNFYLVFLHVPSHCFHFLPIPPLHLTWMCVCTHAHTRAYTHTLLCAHCQALSFKSHVLSSQPGSTIYHSMQVSLFKPQFFIFFFSIPYGPQRWAEVLDVELHYWSVVKKQQLCKSKPQWGTITHQSGWLLSKSLQAINAGEDVEKREPSYTVGGNAN